MNIESQLQKIGLTEKEASLYMAGLETGPATLQQLVDVSGLKRATVYDVIASLKEKGLMKTVARGKRKVYIAEEPHNLFSLLKQKETVLHSILGNLLALQNSAADKPSVRIYQGIGGVKEIYEDTLKKRQPILGVLSSKLPDPRLTGYWSNEYIQRRVKTGSPIRLIAPNVPYYQKLHETDRYNLRETILTHADALPFKNEIYLYGDKVAFLTQDADNSLGLLIESKDVHETMKLLLEHMWTSLNAKHS